MMRGAVEQVIAISCGGEHTLKSILDPWAADCGEFLYLPYVFWAIEHNRGWVLVDCGPHPDLARTPALRLRGDTQMADVRVGADDDVATRLASIGIDIRAVTDVIITHLHYDHCGGLELLPWATVHVQEAELAFAANPPIYQEAAYVAADWASVSNWAVHAGEHDLFGDGTVILTPTPGHTPGHQSVVVRLESEVVICVGDAAYHPVKMAERRLPGYLWNPDAVIESWERLEQVRSATHGTFLFSHYPLSGEGDSVIRRVAARSPRTG